MPSPVQASSLRCVNIACGTSYLPDWINLDYSPVAPEVIRADLTGRLPLADSSVDVVYSSHFFEHIPVSLTAGFLQECRRILKPGGSLRLVVPDFENVCSEYLQQRQQGHHEQADFLMIELLDQCVRKQQGGQLSAVLQAASSGQGGALPADYILSRLGNYIDAPVVRQMTFKRIYSSLVQRAEALYCRFVLSLLPKVFRQQNVSMAAVGELHAWVYDFHALQQALTVAGFAEVARLQAGSSRVADFPCYPLDIDAEGIPRKGTGSMFVEARKPA